MPDSDKKEDMARRHDDISGSEILILIFFFTVHSESENGHKNCDANRGRELLIFTSLTGLYNGSQGQSL